jgi:hypothetical protein
MTRKEQHPSGKPIAFHLFSYIPNGRIFQLHVFHTLYGKNTKQKNKKILDNKNFTS